MQALQIQLNLNHCNVVPEHCRAFRANEWVAGPLNNFDLVFTRLAASRQIDRQGQRTPREFDRGRAWIRLRPSKGGPLSQVQQVRLVCYVRVPVGAQASVHQPYRTGDDNYGGRGAHDPGSCGPPGLFAEGHVLIETRGAVAQVVVPLFSLLTFQLAECDGPENILPRTSGPARIWKCGREEVSTRFEQFPLVLFRKGIHFSRREALQSSTPAEGMA